jgi:hypothetical protein
MAMKKNATAFPNSAYDWMLYLFLTTARRKEDWAKFLCHLRQRCAGDPAPIISVSCPRPSIVVAIRSVSFLDAPRVVM